MQSQTWHSNKHGFEFQQQRNKRSDAVNIILTLLYTQHIGNRWYTSGLQSCHHWLLNTVPPWQQGLYPGVKEVLCVCSKKKTTCFMSTSVTNCFPARCISCGPNRWKSLAAISGQYTVWYITTQPLRCNQSKIRLAVYSLVLLCKIKKPWHSNIRLVTNGLP